MLHKNFIKCLVVFALVICSCQKEEKVFQRENYNDDELAKTSLLLEQTDTTAIAPEVKQRLAHIQEYMHKTPYVLPCPDSLSAAQAFAQGVALADSNFVRFVKDSSGNPLRSEVFGVYPAKPSDMPSERIGNTALKNMFKVEMYNYAKNISTVSVVNVATGQVIQTNYIRESQPSIPVTLKDLALKIAVASKEVQQALGYKPNETDAVMASTKTALNRTRCERSRHLCVAPTFIKADKALWAIVDLTDMRLAGVRWTNVGVTGPAAGIGITERKIQDDKITTCYCDKETAIKRDDWSFKFVLTSSDGLMVSNVAYKNNQVIDNAKLVDWHVSYSGTDGFGYSDAIGCPYFSTAAVVAWGEPTLKELTDENGGKIGFVLEQIFKSEGWPTPCNYNYRQRYIFYNDGRFRAAAASIGRGCGNNGTYRPVFRIAISGNENNFSEWKNNAWQNWTKESYSLQNEATQYTPEGYGFRVQNKLGKGFFIEPSRGQFKDNSRGDNAYTYITKQVAGRDEGESDLTTIGPCCNSDYKQGPEKFIEPNPEPIANSGLVLWYVPQMKNDDTKGREYCWAESYVQDGLVKTREFPCFVGPMFVPIN